MSQDISNTIPGQANRPYRFESSIWGQSLDLYVQTGMLLITASDFDSGQTVRIGLKSDQIEGIIDALRQAVKDAEVIEKANVAADKDATMAAAHRAQEKHDERMQRRAEGDPGKESVTDES